MTVGADGTPQSAVQFTINGEPYKISGGIPGSMSLNSFIRDHAQHRGTKVMCREGGCGACIVTAQMRGQTVAVNSCLVPVIICNGWEITTIEGIGNKKEGYHKIQAALAEHNGSQCGYCSPGMVMNCYSLLQGKQLTMKEIENSFGSNICRCTGYRPILDAFKSFASDATSEMTKTLQDIEELYKLKMCKKTGKACTGRCKDDNQSAESIDMPIDGAIFYKVVTIPELFEVFQKHPDATYVLNGGNTSHGVYRLPPRQLYIDINDIGDLYHVEKSSDSLVLGGMLSLTRAMELFEKYSKDSGFEYLKHLAHHIDLIASVPVRNIGTMAGNLMIKHGHHEFPSDLFLILETAGAQIHILDGPGKKNSMTLLEFLNTDMNHKLIYSIVLPSRTSDYEYRSYKIMPRAQNAHALVNAGFLLKLNGSGNVMERPNIIIGGINPHFLHAANTELYLTGKSIFDKNVLKTALDTLESELDPDYVLPDPSPEFRKTLALGLFYKCILSIKPDIVDSKLRSGGTIMERPLSSGHQDYDTDKKSWPMTQPIPKMESIYQTSGEAEYTNDFRILHNQVFCAFAITDIGPCKIGNVDATEALKMKGVIAFYTAKDIPGKNIFIPGDAKHMTLELDEVLFADKEVSYAGQPVGVIVAESHDLANEAAAKVRITYVDAGKTKPLITLEDAIQSKDETRFMQSSNKNATTKGSDIKHVIDGVLEIGGQYHYYMETQSCVCVPVEDGMDVFPGTQHPDLVQTAIAECLGVKNNSLNVSVRRVGGAYGGKLSRNSMVACACALVCYKLNRPVSFSLSLETNMSSIGKRHPTRHEYEVGVDDNGKIQYMDSKHWANLGHSFNEVVAIFATGQLYNCYDGSTWNLQGYETRTDIASNTYCRAPGTMEGVGMIEHVMDHIARVINKDPLDVRMANMTDKDKEVLEPMLEDIKKASDYEMRKMEVERFNNENRWKKKGIAVVPMNYDLFLYGQFHALVSIYARDGTVSVTHGGIECGQGINTKIAQIAAHTLGIDLKFVTVKPYNNVASPNTFASGGSITSESCAFATLKCCETLLQRLEPIKKDLNNPSWPDLVMEAYQKEVDLSAKYMYKQNDELKPYAIHGVTIAEVEVDILTGQHMVRRVDLIEDVGISFSPEIDLGQIEGAFVMGQGLWTSEELVYDPQAGKLVNNRTWNYKPPGAKDIPADFRIYFRKNAPNSASILRSKASGEPPLTMACSIPLAIRHALNSARKDAGNTEPWYRLDGPVTAERILLTSLTSKDQMVL